MATTTIWIKWADVFQERLDRVIRDIPNIHNTAEDVLVDGKAEVQCDKSIDLLEIARANNITFTCDKFVFKSKDLKFFGGNMTPEGYKVDLKKVQAITERKPPQILQDLQSYLGLVNYLTCFNPKLAELTTPLKALYKRDTVYSKKFTASCICSNPEGGHKCIFWQFQAKKS